MSIFQHKLKISLFLVLITAAFLTVYSVWNYPGDAGLRPNPFPQQGYREGNHAFSHPPDQASPGGRGFPSPHSPRKQQAPNGKNMPSPNGKIFRNPANADAKYTTPLILYSVLFFGFMAAAYCLVSYKNVKIGDTHPTMWIWTLLGTGFFLRMAVAPWVGGHMDLNLFKNWATAAAKDLSGFYLNGFSDYPPLYIYVLYLVGKLASIPALNDHLTLLVKLPSILADMTTAYLIYRVAVQYLSTEISLLLSAFYIFNPAVFINSTFWGQVDSFFTLLVVLAVLMLCENRVWLSTALFSAAVLMKPQGIIFLPVLFFELVRRRSVKHFLVATAVALGTAFVIVLPFSLRQDPLWIFQLFSRTIGEYPYASVNAFNFFSLIGANYLPDSSELLLFSYHTWGMIFIALVTVFSWFLHIKGRSVKFAFFAALMQIAGVFTFSTSMHERYLFPAVALSLLAFIRLRDKRLIWLSAGFSVTVFVNTYAVLYGTFRMGVPYGFTLVAISFCNVVFFGYLVKVGWDITVRNKTLTHETNLVSA